MSSHSFIKENTEPGLPTVRSTPEPSRRYVQWKEDDVGLLLTDLEQPGHYAKWKENKSGFSKRVAEQVFKNVMYHEAIKFKVRWLESRFKIWNQQLTSPQVEQDESAILSIREKMFKEFPYYDRCKPIFTTTTDSPAVQPIIAPAAIENIEQENNNIMKPEPIHMTNEPASPVFTLPQSHHGVKRNPFRNVDYGLKPIKARKPTVATPLQPQPPQQQQQQQQPPPQQQQQQHQQHQQAITRNLYPKYSSGNDSNCIYRNTEEGITDERKVKIMELELELKKMDHQERMQEMKLEQLRLEIELQKLKTSSYNSTSD